MTLHYAVVAASHPQAYLTTLPKKKKNKNRNSTHKCSHMCLIFNGPQGVTIALATVIVLTILISHHVQEILDATECRKVIKMFFC